MSILTKTYENIINLTAGFRYRAEKPIDDRLVVDDYASLNELVSGYEAYKGMIVSVVNDENAANNGTYQYIKKQGDTEFKWYKLTDTQSSDSINVDDDIIIMTGGNSSSNNNERYETTK